MKNACMLLVTLLAFTSCKKHELRSLLGKDGGDVTLKSSSVHPIDMCNNGGPIGGGNGYISIVGAKHADVVISTPITAASFKSLIS